MLRILVPLLLMVMIGGIVVITWLLVTRLGQKPVLPALPSSIVLPEGARPQAVTFAREFVVVVTEDGEILLYARTGGPPVARLMPP